VDILCATKSKGVGLIVRAISFQDFQLYVMLIHQRHRRTDRRTDGRTTCNLNTALCTSASCGKNAQHLQTGFGLSTLIDRKQRKNVMYVEKQGCVTVT